MFHYPPKPGYYGYRPVPLKNSSMDQTKAYSDSASSTSSSEEDSWEEDEEDEGRRHRSKNHHDDGDEDDYEDESDDHTDDNEDVEEMAGDLNGDNDNDGRELSRARHHSTNNDDDKKEENGSNHEEKTRYHHNRFRSYQQIRKRNYSGSIGRQNSIKSGGDDSPAVRSIRNSVTSVIVGNSASTTSSPLMSGSVGTRSLKSRSASRKKKIHKVTKLFGFDLDFLSDMVSPPKALCNNRFELTVEDMVFLGLPIHIGDDGNWRSSKNKHHKHHRHDSRNGRSRHGGSKDSSINSRGTSQLRGSSKSRNGSRIKDTIEEETSGNEDEDEEEEEDCPMYRFHVVFVMNPPVDEYNYRTDEMYHYAISRLTLLLRYEQQKSNYVWKESSNIMKLKEEAMSLGSTVKKQWNYIIEKSSLARVIKQTYLGMKNSDIVNVEINGRFSSFQIPIKTEFSHIPPKNIHLLPGSTLSTISPFNDMMIDPANNPGFHPHNSDKMIYFALLLLDDPETIIRDIRAQKDSVIANFIRMIRPEESLLRLSALSGLGIDEVKLFASHLVYWRRAKATLPLAPRNIYVVSPIAPMDRVYSDSVLFRQSFPNLPPLTSFLALISTNSHRPRPINSIIPSRDHRQLYMDAVAWLFKNGYLTQLYTFLWLKISKEIKIKVYEDMETEKKRRESSSKKVKKKQSMVKNEEDEEDKGESKQKSDDEEGNAQEEEEDDTNSLLIETEEELRQAQEARTGQIPRLPHKEGAKVRSTDNTTKRSNKKETTSPYHQMNSMESGGSRPPSGSMSSTFETSRSSLLRSSVHFEEEEEEDTILTDPESATTIERRWVAKCVEGQSQEVINMFYKLLKYMNGKNPLELVILKENVSRQDVRRLFNTLGDQIVTSRHW